MIFNAVLFLMQVVCAFLACIERKYMESFLWVGISVLCLSLSARADTLSITKLRNSTVHIAIGSGSIVEAASGKHYLLTNGHVCNAGSWHHMMRGNFEGGRLVEGRISKQDMVSDLCASLVSRSFAALKIATSLSPYQQIYTRGYPYMVLSETSGQFIGRQSWDYTYPIEEVGECFKGSQKRYDGMGHLVGCSLVYHDNLTNMYSRPGSSGSPVVDANGDLVGVMSSWIGDSDSGGMVPLEQIQKFFKEL